MGMVMRWSKNRQMAGGKKRDKKPMRTGTLPPQNSKTIKGNVWRCTGGMN